MNKHIYVIVDEGPDGLATCQVSAADVSGAIEDAVKIFGIDPANVLAVIRK